MSFYVVSCCLQIDVYVPPFMKPRRQLLAISKFAGKCLNSATAKVLQEFAIQFLSVHSDSVASYYNMENLGLNLFFVIKTLSQWQIWVSDVLVKLKSFSCAYFSGLREFVYSNTPKNLVWFLFSERLRWLKVMKRLGKGLRLLKYRRSST